MAMTGDPRRRKYRHTVLVAAGWHAAAVLLLVLIDLMVRDDGACDDNPGFCLTTDDLVRLALLLGLFLLALSMMMSAGVAVPLSRRVVSAPAAGTLAALSGLVLAAGVVVVWVALR